MKKLILNLILPSVFVFVSIQGIPDTPVLSSGNEESIVPAVVYKGETIPFVNMPQVEIISEMGNEELVNADIKTKTTLKNDPHRYLPRQKMRRHLEVS